jgi:hypothetical protein
LRGGSVRLRHTPAEQLLDLDNVAGAWKTVATPFWVRVMLIERVFSTPAKLPACCNLTSRISSADGRVAPRSSKLWRTSCHP